MFFQQLTYKFRLACQISAEAKIWEAISPRSVQEPSVGFDTWMDFGAVVAQDMVLSEAFQCLPPVILPGMAESAEENALLLLPQQISDALKIRAISLAHLALHLDW